MLPIAPPIESQFDQRKQQVGHVPRKFVPPPFTSIYVTYIIVMYFGAMYSFMIYV